HPRSGAGAVQALRFFTARRQRGQRQDLRFAHQPDRIRRRASHPVKIPSLLRWATLAAVMASYLVLLHIYTARDTPSAIGALLAIMPMLAVSLLIAWRATHRGAMLSLWFAALALLALGWPLLQSNFALVGLLQHAGTFAMLALFFGRTLRPGDTPIVSRMARQAHGSLPAPLARYTRGVTQAWTAFFTLMAFAS